MNHHGLHYITSYDLKGIEEIDIRYPRDLSKISVADYVCLFLFRLLSDIQNGAYEHQSIDEVATVTVFKLWTNNEWYFPSKQITKQHEMLK